MARRDLAAIGKTGLEPGGGLAIDDGNLVPGTIKKIRTGYTDNASPENDDFHGLVPEVNSRES